MNRPLVAVVLLLVLAAPCLAFGQWQTAQPPRPGSVFQKEQAQNAEKLALAQQIIHARERARQRGAFDAPTARYWTERFMRLSVSQLLAIVNAGPDVNLNEMLRRMGADVLSDNVSPDLGDTSADLVYTKVTPCRVADTRKPGAGGALPRESQRDFQISGSNPALFTPQGGVPCGIPYPGATAVAVNVTVTGSSQPGWLRAWPYGSSATASIINFSAGQTVANGLILPICDEATDACPVDVTVRADSGGTHLLIDVTGYFQKVDKENYRSAEALAASNTSVPLPAGGACTLYLWVSVSAPGPGIVVVEGSTEIEVSHTFGGEGHGAAFTLSTNMGDCSNDGGGHFAGVWIPASLPTGAYRQWAGPAYLSHAVSEAGTYTFYLNGAALSPAAFQSGRMRATFHPQ